MQKKTVSKGWLNEASTVPSKWELLGLIGGICEMETLTVGVKVDL